MQVFQQCRVHGLSFTAVRRGAPRGGLLPPGDQRRKPVLFVRPRRVHEHLLVDRQATCEVEYLEQLGAVIRVDAAGIACVLDELPVLHYQQLLLMEERATIARVLRVRLPDRADQEAAKALIDAGKADEAVKAYPALAKAVIFETGYGPSGLPHLGTFGEVARTTMVRQAFRALVDDQERASRARGERPSNMGGAINPGAG